MRSQSVISLGQVVMQLQKAEEHNVFVCVCVGKRCQNPGTPLVRWIASPTKHVSTTSAPTRTCHVHMRKVQLRRAALAKQHLESSKSGAWHIAKVQVAWHLESMSIPPPFVEAR